MSAHSELTTVQTIRQHAQTYLEVSFVSALPDIPGTESLVLVSLSTTNFIDKKTKSQIKIYLKNF